MVTFGDNQTILIQRTPSPEPEKVERRQQRAELAALEYKAQAVTGARQADECVSFLFAAIAQICRTHGVWYN